MTYILRDGVSFCEVDGGHLIFLDVEKDRYFQLSPQWEHELIAVLESGCAGPSTQRLIDSGVLAYTGSANPPAVCARHMLPAYSALECSSESSQPSLMSIFEVALVTYRAHRQLKRTPLNRVLKRFVSYRNKRTRQYSVLTAEASMPTLLAGALLFARARLYVPVDTRCLPDSLALSMFLARRGFSTQIVIAVAADPFAAHAWVQVGELVLNDSIGAVQAYSPILAV